MNDAKEWKNYLRSRGAAGVIRLARHLWNLKNESRLRKEIISKKAAGHLILPPYLETERDEISNFTLKDPPPPGINLRSPGLKAGVIRELKLASATLPLQQDFRWDPQFQDVEDQFALHRFGWLLREIRIHGYKALGDGVQLIENWLSRKQVVPIPGWNAYDVSERICNWIQFLDYRERQASMGSGTRDHDSPEIPADFSKRLLTSLENQARYLMGKLEYNGSRTGNHLVNNGRALAVAGAYLKNEFVYGVGLKIVFQELPRFFSDDGFLKEGSSHYQLLYGRNILQTLYACFKMNDSGAIQFLAPMVGKICDACRLFLGAVPKGFPLWGDVSPDFPPSWFLDSRKFLKLLEEKPWQKSGRGFEDIGWDAGLLENSRDAIQENPAPGVIKDARHEWARISFGGNLLWVHGLMEPPVMSHYHSDQGSFVFVAGGFPLIVDPGCATYATGTALPPPRVFRGPPSHNAWLIDGLPVFPVGRHHLFPGSYFSNKGEVQVTESETDNRLELTLSGFERLKVPVRVNRTWELGERRLEVKDTFNGEGNHEISSFFHFHPEVQVKSSGPMTWSLKYPSGSMTFKYDGPAQVARLDWAKYSPRYGECVASPRLEFVSTGSINCIHRFLLMF